MIRIGKFIITGCLLVLVGVIGSLFFLDTQSEKESSETSTIAPVLAHESRDEKAVTLATVDSLPGLAELSQDQAPPIDENLKSEAHWEERLSAYQTALRIGIEEKVAQQKAFEENEKQRLAICLLYTSPSPRDQRGSRMPSSA